MDPVSVVRGAGPLILGLPHTGTCVPPAIAAALNDEGLLLRDTDWHIERLYADLVPDVTIVRANFHRYVIDANRDPSGESLYPGQTTTGLVPQATFDNQPIWRAGCEPDAPEIARRCAAYHQPYHQALSAEMHRLRAAHGVAVLYDCHSIRSEIPWLFNGILPDLNIGTDGGRSCAPEIEAAVLARAQASGRRHVLNGRFRGGWTTRHYGRPSAGFHAIQMELAQASHLATEAPPFALDQDKARILRETLKDILSDLLRIAPQLAAA